MRRNTIRKRLTRRSGGCGCSILRNGGGKSGVRKTKKVGHKLGPRPVRFKLATMRSKKELSKSIKGLSGKLKIVNTLDPIVRYSKKFARFIIIFMKTYNTLKAKGKLPVAYEKYAVDLAANLREMFRSLSADMKVDDYVAMLGMSIAAGEISLFDYLETAAYIIDNFEDYNLNIYDYEANMSMMYVRFHDIMKKGPAWRRDAGLGAAGAGAAASAGAAAVENIGNIANMFSALGLSNATTTNNSNMYDLEKALAGVMLG